MIKIIRVSAINDEKYLISVVFNSSGIIDDKEEVYFLGHRGKKRSYLTKTITKNINCQGQAFSREQGDTDIPNH